jgi:thiamine pyrophosphate-dependent acetolactate synthase large subunit-like protein
VSKLLLESGNPLIITESSGQEPEAFRHLVQLSELLSIPEVESNGPSYANFPKGHPLHLGFDVKPFLNRCDLALVVGNRVP